jgi:hypothetical protein
MRTIIALLLFAGVAAGRPPQYPRPPQAPPVAEEPAPVAPPLTYADARAEAIRTGKPLVVYVGREPPLFTPEEWLYWHTSRLVWEGYTGPAVVVSYPGGDRLFWAATLPGWASEGQIRAALTGSQRGYATVPGPGAVRWHAAPAAPVYYPAPASRGGRASSC